MNDRDEMNIPDKLFETQYSASQLVQDTHDTLVLAKVGLGYTSYTSLSKGWFRIHMIH